MSRLDHDSPDAVEPPQNTEPPLPNPFLYCNISAVIADGLVRELGDVGDDATTILMRLDVFCAEQGIDFGSELEELEGLGYHLRVDDVRYAFERWCDASGPDRLDPFIREHVGVPEIVMSYDGRRVNGTTGPGRFTAALRRDGWLVEFADEEVDRGFLPSFLLAVPESIDHYMPLAHREVLEECGGLLPGVWVDRADEFDDELRDITLRSASFDEWYWKLWDEHVGERGLEERVTALLPEFVLATAREDERTRRWLESEWPAAQDGTVSEWMAQVVVALARDGRTDLVASRRRLEELLPSGDAETEAEEASVWSTWKDLLAAEPPPRILDAAPIPEAARRPTVNAAAKREVIPWVERSFPHPPPADDVEAGTHPVGNATCIQALPRLTEEDLPLQCSHCGKARRTGAPPEDDRHRPGDESELPRATQRTQFRKWSQEKSEAGLRAVQTRDALVKWERRSRRRN